MNWTATKKIPPVNPLHLAAAYEHCSSLFEFCDRDRPLPAARILNVLENSLLVLDRPTILTLFKRLCLAIDLLRTVDANWNDARLSFNRHEDLPRAFFELASVEPAYEAMSDAEGSVFFERDIIDEAFLAFEGD